MNEITTDEFLIRAEAVRLRRSDDGGVVLIRDGREQSVGRITAAYPLTHPRRLVSLRDADGQEVGLLDNVKDLDADSRQIVRQELDRSYFMPRIMDVVDLREELNVVRWDVQTNKGPRTFLVRNVRRNVRRIGQRRFVIKDVDGNRYEIRDWITLPSAAQKLLEPYL
ncbi:MAG: DUF1854 domain-containing protein [Phycisphaerae bacterium]|nr:DUF1854 domain-containing protein [Phycisphaerae bacterium]